MEVHQKVYIPSTQASFSMVGGSASSFPAKKIEIKTLKRMIWYLR